MVRRSTPQHRLAERYFPVRVRVAVPPAPGFGWRLNEMHEWLDRNVGRRRYFVGSQADQGYRTLRYSISSSRARRQHS
jgi:hypothetical protein